MKQLIFLLLFTSAIFAQSGKSVLTQAQKDSINALISAYIDTTTTTIESFLSFGGIANSTAAAYSNTQAFKTYWATGKSMYFPDGTYYFTPIHISADSGDSPTGIRSIKGAGVRNTRLVLQSGDFLFKVDGNDWHNFTISDLQFLGNGLNAQPLVHIGGYNYSLQNVHVRESGDDGLYLWGQQIYLSFVESELHDSVSLVMAATYSSTIIGCDFESAPIGILIKPKHLTRVVTDASLEIISPFFENNDSSIIISGVRGVSVSNHTSTNYGDIVLQQDPEYGSYATHNLISNLNSYRWDNYDGYLYINSGCNYNIIFGDLRKDSQTHIINNGTGNKILREW